jgi:hypothetical protein
MENDQLLMMLDDSSDDGTKLWHVMVRKNRRAYPDYTINYSIIEGKFRSVLLQLDAVWNPLLI